MRVGRIFGIALALLVTAIVSQSRADLVEYFLEPIASGSTAYSSTYTATLGDSITQNSVSTSATSGTIYFDVYAGLNQANLTATDDGVNFAYLNFISSGSIGTVPSSISLTQLNGFSVGTGATTGSSTDLNNDGNLDLGSTYNNSHGGSGHPYWSYFKQPGSTIFFGTGTATGPGDRTNILLGVLGYTYSIAPANTGTTQLASITTTPQQYSLSACFAGTIDGTTTSSTFAGARSVDCLNLISSVMMPTITYTPAVPGTGAFSLSFAICQTGLLLNSTNPMTYTVANTGTAMINCWTLSSTATGGSATVSPTSGCLAASGTVTPSPTGTYSAPGTAGNYVITATASSTDPGVTTVTSSMNVNVGVATVAQAGPHAAYASYGTPLSGVVQQGNRFKNLSAVTSGAGSLGTVVTLLDGTASVASTVQMAFRTRATDETPGTAVQYPAGPMAPNGQWLASDVLNLTGIWTGTPYVLQMSFDTSLFTNLAANVADGYLWLGAWAPGGEWQPATTHDTAGPGAFAQTGVYDTYADFWTQADGRGATSLSDALGSWGIDPAGNAWAVIDYDSDYDNCNFGVVPEPGTFALLGVAAVGLLGYVWRRKNHGLRR